MCGCKGEVRVFVCLPFSLRKHLHVLVSARLRFALCCVIRLCACANILQNTSMREQEKQRCAILRVGNPFPL